MKKLFFTTAIALMLVGCSNDDERETGSENRFTYLGETLSIDMAEYHEVDGDLYLFLTNTEHFNVINLRFDDRIFDGLLSMTYTLNDPGGNMEVDTSFDGAYITTDESPLGDHAITGEVTITRNSDDTVTVSFDFITDVGTAAGNYEGIFSER